jgi:hypothetical protein
MRVLLTTWGARGEVQPLVGVAVPVWALTSVAASVMPTGGGR